ncbi:MAG: iron-sulfur cluster-binding domain-containing protein [Chitinophagaceae bacterium]|nr:MAG: iron-sulfur cluster-binding domain-containing protein [Chitinophagaceae bacterium]
MTSSVIKRVRVVAIDNLTSQSRKFTLEPLDGWQPEYKAGQYLTFLFPHLDGEKRRSYSFVSSPAIDEPMAIAVKKIDNGEFSRQLVYNTHVGQVLAAAGIQGLFILPSPAAGNDYFFLAAGSGITPCLSLIRTLLATSTERVVLIYSNSSPGDAMFLNELEQLRKQHAGRFTLHLLFSNTFRAGESRLSKSLLERLLHTYRRREMVTHFFLCGPELYMLMIGITLHSSGITNEFIHREDFDTRPRLFKPRPPDTNPHEVRININGTVKHLTVRFPDSILAVAKKNNLVLPYSCEAGRCGACIATCTSGKTWMAYNEVLTEADLQKGLVLTCQAYPIGGDVELEIKSS